MALLTEWVDLVQRRPAFREILEPLGRVLTAWAEWTHEPPAPLGCRGEGRRGRWSEGEPLIAAVPPEIPHEGVEVLLGPALDLLVAFEEDVREFAEAWDRGEIGPSGLFPQRGRIASVEVQKRSHLS